MNKHHDIKIITTVALLMAVSAAHAANPCIRIRAAACIDGPVVCVADIADVSAADEAAKARLASVVITQLGPEQTEMSLGVSQINFALNKAGIIPASIDLYGASQCLLTARLGPPKPSSPDPDSQLVLPKAQVYTLCDQLTQTVADLLGRDPAEIAADWRCRRNDNLLEEDARDQRFEIKPRSSGNLLGRVSFAVVDTTTDAEETPQRDFQIQGNVSYLCESVVAANPLPSGHVITSDDVKVVPRRVDNLWDVGIGDEELVLGRKLVRSVAANQVISPSMLRKVELIKRKDLVQVSTTVGWAHVTMHGIAQSAAGLGDSVLVCKPGGDAVRGRVTGPGRVVVGPDSDSIRVAARLTKETNTSLETWRN